MTEARRKRILMAEEFSRAILVDYEGNKPVRRHFSRIGQPLPRDGAKLYHVCGLLGVPVVEKYGAGLVGANLRTILDQLKLGKAYGDLSVKQRRSWQEIVKHNRQYLLCMGEVLRKVLSLPD